MSEDTHADTRGLLHVNIGTSISTSAFQALCGLGGRRPGASRVWLTVESPLCAHTMTRLRRRIIRFPALQLFPHQALHLFPVDLAVTTQSLILTKKLRK